MEQIRVENVTKRFGNVVALDGVTLSVEKGELFAVLGPSGCGKSTLLRVIAGLELPDSGRVLIKGVDVTYEKPQKRRAVMVFQNWALWPHMTVFENVAYGLRLMKLPADDVARRVKRVLELVKLEGLESRYPHQLSGGQQQRVALARALVVEPEILLLDEPLSNLDARLRVEMRDELRALIKKLGITAMYVTHDQEEAMAIADRMAVMSRGKIVQVGGPAEVYHKPSNLFAAIFIGRANVIRGAVERVEGGAVSVRVGDTIIYGTGRSGGLSKGMRSVVVIRPHNIELACRSTGEDNVLPGRVQSIRFLGGAFELKVETPVGVLTVASKELAVGEDGGVRLCFGKDDALVFEDSGEAL